nr:N-acetylmuramoyl-L-alanine amidase [Chitinophagaceae bacterium]
MIKKLPLTLFFCFSASLLFLFAPAGAVAQKASLRTIIIDAGHGGKDHGAKGSYSYEKDICLAIALKLGKNLEDAFPEIKILYTRKTDVYPELKARADFANGNKGDLFLCVHVNAAPPIRHNKFAGYRNEVTYTGRGKKRKKHMQRVPKYTVYFTDNPSNGTETFIWAADRTDEKEKFIGEDVNTGEHVYDSTEFIP